MTSAIIIVSAVVGAIGAYLVAARQFSGKIETSDAKELWQESRSIRDWSTQRIGTLNENVERLEERVGALEGSNEQLAAENQKLITEIAELNTTIKELRDEIVALVEELRTSKKQVAKLEEESK
jgi:chromosome segregation ATPase